MFLPSPSDYCYLSPAEKPKLIVVIDTEEEFDWTRDFSRNNVSVRAMRQIGRLQDIFDNYGITPIYVVDYPVASQPEGYRPLQEIYSDGRCLIGAHVHPWVNPPFVEQVNAYNSFPGNLPKSLEEKKIKAISQIIGEHFGEQPTIYKAGRYGSGPHTAAILEKHGFEVDLSVCPNMDYSAQGGPDFTNYSACPYWFGTHRRLLEIPLTTGFTGILKHWGSTLYPMASHPALARYHMLGIMARLKFLNKVWMSPEGYTLKENIDLLKVLYHDGLRVFSFGMHSPSVEPGHTPYVRSKHDLERFLSHCQEFFDYFIYQLDGEPSTPLQLKKNFLESKPPH